MKTKIVLVGIILALCGVILQREITHAEYKTQIEYEIQDIQADYYNDGFIACLEQF
jgi:hypothetical protein